MKARAAVLGVFLVLVSQPAFSWCKVDHQILYEVSVRVAANDGGEDFAAARKILELHRETMMQAVIDPDVNVKLIRPFNPPLYPPLRHGHEAFEHVGFDGLERHDSGLLAGPYCQRAIERWQQGDTEGALTDLGRVIHLVQDAACCAHSNFLNLSALRSARWSAAC